MRGWVPRCSEQPSRGTEPVARTAHAADELVRRPVKHTPALGILPHVRHP
jgi:hypothetical protein